MHTPEIAELEKLHEQWEDVHSTLRNLEGELSAAITLYARGRAERPDDLMRQVRELRAKCAQKFEAMMAVVSREPKSF